MRAGVRFLVLVLVLAAPARSAGPPVVRQSLSNGLRIQVSEQHAVPAVIVDVLIDAGSRLDPRRQEGVANLTADLLDEGTQTRSAQEISRQVDFLGARLVSAAAADFASVRLTVLRKHFGAGLDLLADCLRHPVFAPAEMKRRREVILAGMKAEEDNPGSVAGKAFRRALFDGGEYGHPVEGWPETVSRLTRDNIRDFYRHWYGSSRTLITVVGDIDAGTAVQMLEQRFGDWRRGSKGNTPPRAAGAPPAGTIVIEKPVSQANIILGERGVERTNPDYYALTVMNYILGGGSFSSRLFTAIRTQAGLAYAVTSFFTANKLPGSFQVVMQTKNASATDAIRMARREIERLRENLVSEQELEDAKRYLTGSFPLRLTSNAKIAGFLGQVEFYGLGADYAERYPERINAVTREKVRQVARQYLDPEHMILVVVGVAEKTGIRAPG